MSLTALAFSPHLDDAAFSCGGTLARLARAGWRVVVATLFTRSVPDPQGFALACQLDKGLGPEIDYMALRRAEDEAAMRALGAEALHVPLPEAPHRGYESAAALFGPLHPDDPIGAPLLEAIDDLLRRVGPDLVLVPQAIGGHVDHVALVRALDTCTVPRLWWRDFPYTIRPGTPARPFAERVATLPERRVALDDRALEARAAACRAYASQLGYQFGGPDGLIAALATAGPTEILDGQPMPTALG